MGDDVPSRLRLAPPPELNRLLEAADPAECERAWSGFLASYNGLLLHTARSLARDHDAAMDAYAFVLEQLRRDDFRRLRAYAVDSRSKFTTWLVVVARRLCVDHLRHRYGRVRVDNPARADERAYRRRLVDLLAEEVEVARLPVLEASNPENEAAQAELTDALGCAVSALEPRDRLLLRLRFEDELSGPEIARVLGFSTPFHFYRRLRTVLASLRRALEARGIRGAS